MKYHIETHVKHPTESDLSNTVWCTVEYNSDWKIFFTVNNQYIHLPETILQAALQAVKGYLRGDMVYQAFHINSLSSFSS